MLLPLSKVEHQFQGQEGQDQTKASQLLEEVVKAVNLEFNTCKTPMSRKFCQILPVAKESKRLQVTTLPSPRKSLNNGAWNFGRLGHQAPKKSGSCCVTLALKTPQQLKL